MTNHPNRSKRKARATTVEQNGSLAGEETGRVFFTASGFNPNHHEFVNLGTVAKANEFADRLNAAQSDDEAQALWNQA